MNTGLVNIMGDFVSLFYPQFCEACRRPLVKGEDSLCTYCLSDLPKSNDYQNLDNPLFRKFEGRLPLLFANSFLKFRKRGSVQRILHALKYHNRPQIGYKLGLVYGTELTDAGLADVIDVIIPVPLHVSRMRQRGYNQSEEWANGLSEALKKPVDTKVLIRIKKTQTQTKRTKLNRWENVSEVFSAKDGNAIQGKNVLLVDDVVTTGATLEACGNTLLAAGCNGVAISCIAFTQ